MTALAGLLADLTSGDSQRAETAAAALPEHGEAALQALSSLTKDRNSDVRWWALRALSGFAQPSAGELLAAGLRDADLAVRQCATLALSKHPHAAAIPSLIDMLKSEETLLARLAGDALVALGAAAVEPLIAGLETDQLNAKVEAARALALIGDTRAVSPFFKLLDSDSLTLEHWISEGFEKMGVGMSFFQPGS